MTTTRTITDPAERKAGDFYRIVYTDGAVLSGKARELNGDLVVGVKSVRDRDWHIDVGAYVASVTVTREVEVPPEPTGFGALVELGDGGSALRFHTVGIDPWFIHGMGWSMWSDMVRNYGVTRVVFEGVDL